MRSVNYFIARGMVAPKIGRERKHALKKKPFTKWKKETPTNNRDTDNKTNALKFQYEIPGRLFCGFCCLCFPKHFRLVWANYRICLIVKSLKSIGRVTGRKSVGVSDCIDNSEM